MTVSYDLTADDLVAFAVVHNQRSPTLQRQRAGCLLAALAAMLALPASILLTSDKPMIETASAIWPLLLGPGLLLLLMYPYTTWRLRRISKQMYNEGQNANATDECTLEIQFEGLREIQSSGQTMRNWNAVEKILLTDNHAFIYVSTVEAFVLPCRAFGSGREFQAFIDEIAKRAQVTPEAI